MLQLILLSLLCGGAAFASDLSAQSGCAQGAAYWCKNLWTALQCGQLEHCMQAGWRQTAENMCSDCEQIVTILVRMAKESTFKEAVKKYLEDECKTIIPVGTLIPQCEQLVDKYFSLLVSLLEGQVQPNVICAKVGFCPSASKDTFKTLAPELEELLQLLQGKGLILPGSHTQGSPGKELPIPLPLCWMCKSVVGRAESLVPKAAIGAFISKFCLLLPTAASGMCQCLMERYTVIIVDMILSKLGPSLVCGMILMCATEENCGTDNPQALLSVPADACQTCLAMTSQAKAALKGNSTQTELEAALLTACSINHLDWQECKSFIDHHQPKLATLLVKPLSAQATCQKLGACVPDWPSATACAQGPKYWCSSLSTAKQCKAVQHCQAHVWL